MSFSIKTDKKKKNVTSTKVPKVVCTIKSLSLGSLAKHHEEFKSNTFNVKKMSDEAYNDYFNKPTRRKS